MADVLDSYTQRKSECLNRIVSVRDDLSMIDLLEVYEIPETATLKDITEIISELQNRLERRKSLFQLCSEIKEELQNIYKEIMSPHAPFADVVKLRKGGLKVEYESAIGVCDSGVELLNHFHMHDRQQLLNLQSMYEAFTER